MGAMGGPQSTATPRKGVDAGIRLSSSATTKPAGAPRRKPMNLTVDVENLDPPSISTSPIEKHIMADASSAKPRRNSSGCSTFLQPDQFMSELKVIQAPALKVKIGAPSHEQQLPVSDSPTSARSVRSIRASFETPHNDQATVWEPPSPRQLRKSPKPLEWNARINAESWNGSTDHHAAAQSRRPSRSIVVSQHESRSELETFYDSLPTLESPESPSWSSESLRLQELPKLELSYEGKPAPTPAHLRARTSSTLPASPKPHPEPSRDPEGSSSATELQKSSSSGRASKITASPALLKLQAQSALLESAQAGNMRPEKLRSASSRKSVSQITDVDTVSTHSQPLKPSTFDVDEVSKDHVTKPTGLLRRMLHWSASKLGKKSKNYGGKGHISNKPAQLTESLKPDGRIAAAVEAAVEAAADSGKIEEAEATDHRGVEANLDPADSPRSSVSSVGTTYSEGNSKSHSHKHKRHVKSEIVKSKLWLLRVHQKMQGRSNKESGDESDGNHATFPAATFHGFTDASSNKTVDKKMLTASARFNPERSAISKLVTGKHRRNSTWDAGKLSTEDLFSPKHPLAKSDAQGLLTPPRPLTGDATTDFQRRRRPTSLSTDAMRDSTSSPSPSPRRVRPVSSTRVAPDHQAGAPLRTAPTTATFLQTAALILASPGNKDEPNNQLFENSRKCAAPPNPHTTPPISPTGVRSPRGLKGFNSPLPLPIRVGTSPSSPVYPASSPRNRFAKSPGRDSVPTSPPGWSGMPGSSPSSPGMFAPSPGWIEMQRSPGHAGRFQSSQTPPGLPHARSHGSIAGEQLLLEDISFTTLVKRTPVEQHPKSAQAPQPRPLRARSEYATPRDGVVVTAPPSKPRVADERESSEKQKSGTATLSSSPRPQLGISFEQIVAGRNRSPPTDNTLMKFFFKCREIDHLNKFLALQKKRFLESFNTDSKCFHMILSEAGQGLSSMISTLCTAWLLENTMASASVKWHPVPVMNMCQKEMWQHRDAAWLFHVCGIDASVLLFIDEVSLSPETVVAGRVKRAVTGEDILQTKDEVSSSCTIVSEKFRQEAPKLLQARYMKTLLLAGILVDTKNLSTGSSRDKQQATILLVGAGSLGRNGFYNHLVNIRDENYVTTFINEIYGDSNVLKVEHSAPKEPGVEQSKPMSRPTSTITPEEPQKPPAKASRKSEPELKLRSKSAPGRKPEPEVKNRLPSNRQGWFRSTATTAQ